MSIYFYFGLLLGHTGAVQELLLGVHSGIISGGAWGTTCDAEDQTQGGCLQGTLPTHCAIITTPKATRLLKPSGVCHIVGQDGSTCPRSCRDALKTATPDSFLCPDWKGLDTSNGYLDPRALNYGPGVVQNRSFSPLCSCFSSSWTPPCTLVI